MKFCIGKMTNLNFRSGNEPNNSIFQKYPVVWWSDLILLMLLTGSLWTYYIREENMDFWFKAWCRRFPQFTMWGGYGIILLVFVAATVFLVKQTWKNGE